MVISFDQYVHVLSPPTNNRNQLRNAIRNVAFGDGTSLYEAVEETINNHLKRIEGRKAVVLFTDGVDTTSRRATYEGTLRDTEEIDALFYTIRYDTSGDLGYSGYPPGRGRRRGGGTWGDILGRSMGGSVNKGPRVCALLGQPNDITGRATG